MGLFESFKFKISRKTSIWNVNEKEWKRGHLSVTGSFDTKTKWLLGTLNWIEDGNDAYIYVTRRNNEREHKESSGCNRERNSGRYCCLDSKIWWRQKRLGDVHSWNKQRPWKVTWRSFSQNLKYWIFEWLFECIQYLRTYQFSCFL